MSNRTINTLSGSLAPVNAQLEKLQQNINDKLDRIPDEGQMNAMQSVQDANDYRIINLGEPQNPNDAARLRDVTVTQVIAEGGLIVESLLDLAALQITAAGTRAVVTGAANAPFELLPEGAVAQDGDITTSGGRVWELDVGTRPNLLWFGVTEGGDTSSTVQLAFNRAEGLYVPKGSYTVANLDLNGTSLYGEEGATFVESGSSSSYTFTDSTSTPVQFSKITLDGNSVNVKGMLFSNKSQVFFNDVEIKRYLARVVYFDSTCENVQIIGGYFHDLTNEAFLFLNKQTVVLGGIYSDIVGHAFRFGRFNDDPDALSGINSAVSGCVFENVQNNPILFELDSRDAAVTGCMSKSSRGLIKVESTGLAGDIASRVSITGNRVEQSIGVTPTGIDGNESERLTIVGNYVDTCYEGISAGTGSIVQGNTVVNASNQSIRTVGNSVKIQDNLVLGESLTDTGIQIEGDDITVQDNTVSDCTNRGITLAGTSTRPFIEGNRVSTCVTNIRAVSTVVDGFIVNNFTNGATSTEIQNASGSTTVTGNYTV